VAGLDEVSRPADQRKTDVETGQLARGADRANDDFGPLGVHESGVENSGEQRRWLGAECCSSSCSSNWW